MNQNMTVTVRTGGKAFGFIGRWWQGATGETINEKKNWEGKEKGFVVKDMKDDAGRIEGEGGGRDGEVEKKRELNVGVTGGLSRIYRGVDDMRDRIE